MKTMWGAGILGLLLVSLIAVARADVYHGVAVQAVLLPEDESGSTKVAFQFDFSTMRTGENRQIEEALLDWKLSGVSEKDMMSFVAYPVTQSWTNASVGGGDVPAVGKEAVADWQIGPSMTMPDGGKLARLDLTEMVRSWTIGAVQNYGVVVASPDMDRATIASQFQNAKLVVRYGFRDN